jgi:hypothetical protein
MVGTAIHLTLLCLATGNMAVTESASPPRVTDLVRAGKETAEKIRQAPCSWKVRCRFANGFTMETKVVCAGGRRAWTFAQVVDGRSQAISRVIESNGVWYVMEYGRNVKCNPYEAELRLPGGYLLLSLAELHCAVDERRFALATFEGRRGTVASYRLPLPEENRRTFQQAISEMERLGLADASGQARPEIAATMKMMREYLAKGMPLSVDETTGIVVECRLRDTLVSFENFEWLSKIPDTVFMLEKDAQWDDQTRRWAVSELGDCVMVAHDPLSQPGVKVSSLDGYLLNLKTGRVRRLPYQGFCSMPGCFLKDRREVIVVGFDTDGRNGLVKVNLDTGANTSIEAESSGRVSLGAELSPDGKRVATMQMLGGERILDFQVRIVNLEDGRSRVLGQPGRIGSPFSWLPDGTGLILKRFERTSDPKAIEPRVLCHLSVDGKLTDLRRGDSPVVLRKSRKILYEDGDPQRWYTCTLDGRKAELFAGGLEKHGTPAVSPDETRAIFARYEEGKLPKLLLFEFGKSQGLPVTSADGFTGMPVWR